MYSGSASLKPNKIAKSVACPFPVSDKEPYKSTFTASIVSKRLVFLNF